MKDRKEKIKREIEEQFYKPIIERTRNEVINKNVVWKKPKMIKDKIINDIWTLFEIKKGERKKKEQNGRINKDRIIRDIRTLFETKKEQEERKKKKQNEKIIKDKIIRDINDTFKNNKKKEIFMSLKE